MKRTYHSNLFFRGRGSHYERNPVPHNSPNPLHNISNSLDKEDLLVQFDMRDEYSDKHLKYPSIRKGQTKLGLELKITNSLGQDQLQKSTSSTRSKGLSEVPFLNVLSLYPAVGSPKSDYEMYQLYHRKKTYDQVRPRPIEKVPLHLQIPTLNKEEGSLSTVGTNFNTSPVVNQNDLSVTNLESSLALGINNSTTRQQNNPPKPEIKRNFHKQRAILRDLTCGEPKHLTTNKTVKLYVEPATMTYSGAEDIIEDLLSQSGLQSKEKTTKGAKKEKKDLSLQFDMKSLNRKRIINKGGKLHIDDSTEGITKTEISCHRVINKKEKETFGLDFIAPSKGGNQSALLQLRRLVAFVPANDKVMRK